MKKPKQRRRPTGDYTVGYCKPPVGSRFKPGHSGNEGGRKKWSPTGIIRGALEDIIKTKVPVVENGQTRQVSFADAFKLRFRAKMLSGSLKDMIAGLQTIQRYAPEMLEQLYPSTIQIQFVDSNGTVYDDIENYRRGVGEDDGGSSTG